MRQRVIPGLGVSLGITLLYLSTIVLLPIAALILQAAQIEPAQLFGILSSPRTLAAIRVTLTTALIATVFNAVYGLLLAWVLARYMFPGKSLLDALIDVPFALPTAVAGLALTGLFAKNGWFGAPLADIGIQVAYTPLGIMIAMAFTSIPFVVRTVQPVLETLPRDVEEAATTLGANQWQIMRAVIFPAILPALLSGSALSFARSLGEFGAVIFIAGNLPMKTEIVSLLTFIRLEEFDYVAAAAIACTMLFAAFVMLLVINAIQSWQLRYVGRGE